MTRVQGVMMAVGASAALALACLPASAEGTSPLTLREAVCDALASSEGLQSANARLEGAAARIDEARSRTAPTVSVGLMPVHLGLLDPTIGAMLNNLAPGLSPNLISETLTLSQVLYDGGRSKLGQDAATVGTEMATEATRLARQNVAFDTSTGYLNVLRAESLHQAVLLTQRQVMQHLYDAQLREKNGVGSHFDTLQAETAVANIQDRVIQARNAVKLARLSLGTALHQPLSARPLDPTPSVPVVASDEAAIMRGLDQRPEIEVAKRQAELDRITTDISGRDRLPVAAAQGIVIGNGLSIPAYVVMGSLNWTLYDGGKTESQVRAGEKSVQADEANLSALRENLRLEVEKAVADRDESKERIATAEQGLKTAQAGYDLASLRYTEGAGTGTEVIDAASALSQAQSGYIQATYDELASELRLAKALGIDLAKLLCG